MSAAGAKLRVMPRSSEFDRTALNAILARQYQVISRGQAMASGMTKNALAHRLRAAGPWPATDRAAGSGGRRYSTDPVQAR
jgi:hypothetical protein